MAWIELHQSLFDHRKVIEAADALCMPEVHLIGHLAALWSWALDNAPNGHLPDSDRIIARGARWDGDPSAFRNALRNAGLIDADNDGRPCIHDWDEYGGKLTAQRTANAERQRAFRERQKAQTDAKTGTSRVPTTHVTVTSPLRNALDNTREEKSTEDDPPSPHSGKATYAAVLNGAMSSLLSMFQAIDKQYTDGWLRTVLVEAESHVGPLPRDKLGKGLDLAVDQIKRAAATGKVTSPRPFARKLIVTYLMEQKHGRPAA